ncbi:terminase small subunit [Anaeromusa sp.]|uniref:terminase small subunit n=1 Tax=Anaeromusa sp. TaxID=1872520 RepID=UPI00261730AF|nr:terminase small subunit [Anaeromusa sp.]MDD3157013.1 terminase small subunit [Anaeromusa sp.]
MPRARSPERDKAYEIWRSSSGKKPLKDIAEELGVSDVKVRKWKNTDKWDEKLKGNVPKQVKTAVKAVFTAPENEELTEREQLFCRFFVNNRNATQAAIKAGYSPNTARVIGYENLTKPYIRSEIERLKGIQNQALILSADDIVERYMRIAFADMTDFTEFGTEDVPVYGADGQQIMLDDGSMATTRRNYMNFKSHEQVDGGLICEISVGKSGMKVKLEDRQKALSWLADYFNMNPQNKHKQWFDKQRLDLEKRKIEVAENKDKPPEKQSVKPYVDALKGTVSEVWNDEE